MAGQILREKIAPLGLGLCVGLALVVLVKVVFSADSTSTTGAIADAQTAFSNKDYATSLNLLKPLAEKGNAKAQHSLATHYRYGLGVGQDNETAVKWEVLAATQGYAKAESALGAILLNGDLGLRPNDKQALSLFQQAADQGDAAGEFYVGVMYNAGRGGVTEDDDEAMNWYRKAADGNSAYAQYVLGVIYANGKGVPKDHDEAMSWFGKAAQNDNESIRNAARQIITSIELEQAPVTELLSGLNMRQIKILMNAMSIMNCGQPIGTKYSLTNFTKDRAFQGTPWPQVVEIASKLALTKCGSAQNTMEIALFD